MTLTTARIMTLMMHEKIIMEHCRNDTDRSTTLYSERNLFRCHNFHQKPHTEIYIHGSVHRKSILTLILRRSRTGTVGSTLLPATREQHDQNCTQSH